MKSPKEKPGLRVAHVIKGLGRGGAETLIGLCARAGQAGNTYSAVYFVPWKDALVDELADSNVSATCLPASSPPALFARVPALVRWLKKQEIDVVHAHLPLSGVVARLACKLASVPLVYTEHNLQERYHRLTRRANLMTWGLQSQVIAVSAEVAESLGRHAKGNVPVRVVRNGIDTRAMVPDCERGRALREQLGIPGDAPVVGTVAVFRKQKRLDHWLEVASRLQDQLDDLHCLLVGDGPLLAKLQARADQLDLRNVHWVGLQDDVAPYFAAMDLYMMTSEFEGLPLALLEAMSCGLPAVVTAVGGIAEVVDSRSARLCDFGDLDALTDYSRTLLSSANESQALGRNARTVVVQDFSIERMASELERIYIEVARR